MIEYDKTERLQQFLTEGFTAAELRRIRRDNAYLKPVSADVGEMESVNRFADALIDFCVHRRLLPLLHQLTAAQNPKRYQEVFGELPTGYTDADLQVYLAHVRDAFALLDLRGMSGASQALSIPLEQVYVELQAEADNPSERDYDRLLFEQDVREQLEQIQHFNMDEDAREEQVYRVLASNAYELRLVQSGDFDSQGRPVPTKEQTMYLADVARRERRAVILGDPGSGKTTLLKYLAFHYARALSQGAERVLIIRVDVSSDGEAGCVEEDQPSMEQERGDEQLETTTAEEDWGPTLLPIYVRIATYANARKENEQLSIQDFLPTYWRGLQLPLPETTIRTIFDDFLKRNNVLLLLDGLDEIADFKERQEIVRQVELLINAHVHDPMVDLLEAKRNPKRAIEMRLPLHSGGNQVILTSRAAGYRAAPLRESIRHYRIQDMSDAAIDAFAALVSRGRTAPG
jgi:hypothetical protein